MYGSMLDPIYRYITQATIYVSPADPNGNKVARCFYTHMAGGDPRLKRPEFKLEVKFDPSVQQSYLEAVYR